VSNDITGMIEEAVSRHSGDSDNSEE